MAKQLTAPGCKYSIVARVDTTIYSPDQKWTLDVPAGQSDFIAETNEIIIPADAMLCRMKRQIDADLARVNVLGRGAGSLATFVTRAIEQIVGKGKARAEYGDGKLTVSLADSVTAAQMTAVENLLDRLLPKDVTDELDEMPLGYMRAEFLEGTGVQYIKTSHEVTVETGVRAEYKQEVIDSNSIEPVGTRMHSGPLYYTFLPRWRRDQMGAMFGMYSGSAFNFMSTPYARVSAELNFKNSGLFRGVDAAGNKQETKLPEFNAGIMPPYTLWGSNVRMRGIIWSCEISQGEEIISSFIPVLDSAGVPCMYDLITRKPFRNQGTGQFTVGMTVDQVINLADLPATGGKLTVSLPWEAQWITRVKNALDKASARGWIITVQYRNPEVATENIPVGFLESTGTQYCKIPTEVDREAFRSETDIEFTAARNLQVMGFSTYARYYWGVNAIGQYTIGGGALIRDTPSNVRRLVVYENENYEARLEAGGKNATRYSADPLKARSEYGVWYPATIHTAVAYCTAKIFSVKFFKANMPLAKLLPALSPTGAPCMHDTVSDQNFYNSGTGAFIAGFETAEQALKLATLPDVTAETDEAKKSLTVSLPWEARFDSSGVPAALQFAADKGWTIITQYREPAATTMNLEADFLESTGTQYIDTGFLSRDTGRVDYWSMNIKYFKSKKDNKETLSLVPTISPDGTPCMYDTVSRQNFYNQGTGSFIVGFDGAEKAAMSLAKLPVTTDGKLTVSLPLEVALDDNVQAALSIATARGWTITVQYRESEVATANLEADFLESTGTGTQVIDTGIVKSGEYRAICEYAGADVMRHGNWFGWQYNVDNVTYQNLFKWYGATYLGRFTHESTQGYILPLNYDQQGYIGTARNRLESTETGNRVVLNGNVVTLSTYSTAAQNTENPKNEPVRLWSVPGAKIYAFGIVNDTAKDVDLIPVIDPTGTPGMYDTVSKQTLRNSGTGQFTVGFDTIKKAAISISKLPVVTGGTLTVSLPPEAEEDELIDEACKIAESRGWTIIEQIRTN